MVWVIAFGELFFGDLWCVVWGYGGMRTHFSLLNPKGVWARWHSGRLHALRAEHVQDQGGARAIRGQVLRNPRPIWLQA